MNFNILLLATLLIASLHSLLFGDGNVTDCKEYDSVENKNPYSDSFAIDHCLMGKWISIEDKDYKMIDNYGIVFTRDKYFNTTLY